MSRNQVILLFLLSIAFGLGAVFPNPFSAMLIQRFI